MRGPPFSAIALALLLSGSAFPLYGQGPRLPTPSKISGVDVQPGQLASLPDSTPHRRTYWVEGGLIGALGGVVLAQLVNGLCESSGCHNDRRVFVMLVGGSVVGALIGGGIEKKP